MGFELDSEVILDIKANLNPGSLLITYEQQADLTTAAHLDLYVEAPEATNELAHFTNISDFTYLNFVNAQQASIASTPVI
jgi:hypothetical protein